MMTRRAALTALVAGGLAGCGPDRGAAQEVVLYSSLDEGYALALAGLFESRTGCRVRVVSDTEMTKSTGLINRLQAERDRPQADVFLSGDPMRAALLKLRGLTSVWQAEGNRGVLAAEYGDPAGHWTATTARLRLIIAHRPKTGGKVVRPASVLELAKREWAHRTCLANPLFGTTSMHAAVLFQSLGEQVARGFFEDFIRHGGRVVASNGEVRRRVASGEFAFGVTDSDDVSVALRDRQPVEFIVPDQDGIGVVVVPCAACLIRGGPHPEAARLLMGFLASTEAEGWLAQSEGAHLPLQPGVAVPRLFPKGLNPLKRATARAEDLSRLMDEGGQRFLESWMVRQAL